MILPSESAAGPPPPPPAALGALPHGVTLTKPGVTAMGAPPATAAERARTAAWIAVRLYLLHPTRDLARLAAEAIRRSGEVLPEPLLLEVFESLPVSHRTVLITTALDMAAL